MGQLANEAAKAVVSGNLDGMVDPMAIGGGSPVPISSSPVSKSSGATNRPLPCRGRQMNRFQF